MRPTRLENSEQSRRNTGFSSENPSVLANCALRFLICRASLTSDRRSTIDHGIPPNVKAQEPRSGSTGALAFSARFGYGEFMDKCLACGKPKGAWSTCDRWDCPLLLLKDTIYRDDPPQQEPQEDTWDEDGG